jgi:hypothetical protein
MEGSRRFPASWRADKIAGAYVVRNANGRAIVYSRERARGAAGEGAAREGDRD